MWSDGLLQLPKVKSMVVTVWVVCQNELYTVVTNMYTSQNHIHRARLPSLSSLSFSVQDYLQCISNQARLALSSEDKGSLFGNIEDIYHFNRYDIHAENYRM